ncbi:hypothetical protein J6590_026949 [Homalodisca vitripennis]|nr:hypothetical protein J6590_026949 [Homalodisca vitripennis]
MSFGIPMVPSDCCEDLAVSPTTHGHHVDCMEALRRVRCQPSREACMRGEIRRETELNDADVHVDGFSLDNGPDVVIASPEPLYLDYDSDIITATPEPCSRVIVPTSRIPQ